MKSNFETFEQILSTTVDFQNATPERLRDAAHILYDRFKRSKFSQDNYPFKDKVKNFLSWNTYTFLNA